MEKIKKRFSYFLCAMVGALSLLLYLLPCYHGENSYELLFLMRYGFKDYSILGVFQILFMASDVALIMWGILGVFNALPIKIIDGVGEKVNRIALLINLITRISLVIFIIIVFNFDSYIDFGIIVLNFLYATATAMAYAFDKRLRKKFLAIFCMVVGILSILIYSANYAYEYFYFDDMFLSYSFSGYRYDFFLYYNHICVVPYIVFHVMLTIISVANIVLGILFSIDKVAYRISKNKRQKTIAYLFLAQAILALLNFIFTILMVKNASYGRIIGEGTFLSLGTSVLVMIVTFIYNKKTLDKVDRKSNQNNSNILDVLPRAEDRISMFIGSVLGNLGITLLSSIIIIFSLGIAAPWALCMKERWIKGNTIIDGKLLNFDGTGGKLFGRFIKWSLLTFITIGIYYFWVPVKYHDWVARHTHVSEIAIKK